MKPGFSKGPDTAPVCQQSVDTYSVPPVVWDTAACISGGHHSISQLFFYEDSVCNCTRYFWYVKKVKDK